MKKRAEPVFQTEAALCAAFIAWAKQWPEWTAYAETAEWDILMVHADGTQIGVQAKLRLNLQVLYQAMESYFGIWTDDHTGPDFRAILVPEARSHEHLCNALGITPITYDTWHKIFSPTLQPKPNRWGECTPGTWHYTNSSRRHPLPAYVPDVPAGVPSPSPLTPWKEKALQVCAVMELRGYVTRKDFTRAGIDYRRWRESWLQPVPDQPGRWTWLDGFKGFAAQHPIVYPQVREKVVADGLAREEVLL